MSDARQFLRVAAELAAEVVAAGGTVRGTTRDVSLKGAYVHVGQPFPEGSTCELTLLLDEGSPIAAGMRQVRARGFVSRSDADGMAIEFQELIGLDSWDHLRGLVLLNAEQPLEAQEQFAAHRGLKPRGG
jgi:hypothetical protein